MTGSDGALVPTWLRRLGAFSWRVLVLIALGGALIWLAFVLGTVTASVVVALVVAATFVPLGRRLRARGWSPTLAAAAVTGSAVVMGTALLVLLVLAFVPYVPDLLAAIQRGVATLVAELDADQLEAIVAGAQAWLADNLGDVVGNVANLVTVGILALFLTFFLLQDGEKGWGRTLAITDGWRRERVDRAGREALDRVGGYLRGTAALSGVVAVTNLAYLTILGVPLPAPLAVLSFLGGFVPYIGGLVATAVILLVAWGTSGTQTVVILAILIAVTRLIVSNVLRPIIYGRSVGLHPAVILLVLPAGGALAGVVGVFAAVPVAVFLSSITSSVIAALGPAEPETTPHDVPVWLDRLAQWGWRLLAALGIGAAFAFVLGAFPVVVVPVIIAAILASSILPLVIGLVRRGWGRTRAAALVTAGSYAAVVAITVVAVVSLGGPLADAVAGAQAGAEGAGDATGGALDWLGTATDEVSSNVLIAVAGVLGALAELALVLALAGLLTFYVLRDGGRGWAWLTRGTPEGRRAEMEQVVRSGIGVLGGYMGGTAVISLVGAASQWVIMVVLGLPFAVPVAVLSFFAGFIPYVGSFVSTLMVVLVGLAFGSTTDLVILLIYTVVFNIIQGNVVTPLVYRDTVHLHAAVILLAIPAGGAIAGIAGMFLAVPILGLIGITWRPILRLLESSRDDRPSIPAAGDPVEEGPAPTPASAESPA
jgi:predicted PurR-regulated permease PerM